MKGINFLHTGVFCCAMGLAGGALAVVPEDHASLEGPFASPMDVTKACLECHEDAAKEVMKGSHWTWEREQEIPGHGKQLRGKKNAINNYCISVNSNWPRCTSCHAGYGWKDETFDFSDQSRVDCLVCHDTTGTYRKHPAGAGFPVGYTGNKKFDKNPVDLSNIAQHAGTTSRKNCLNCHANGGGGNNVKHGDIDQSMIRPNRDIDVHMAFDDNNFTCQKCHETKQHMIGGDALMVSPGVNQRVKCETCHQAQPHKKRFQNVLNKHTAKVACQTCHIPIYAKHDPTKMTWDWSQAKNPRDLPKDKRVIKDKHGHVIYHFKKGAFTYATKVKPEYYWYNGTAGAYLLGDKIDPTKPTDLNPPKGQRSDAQAKIYPFKVERGKQIYDSKNKYFITPKLWGTKGDPDAFWVNFDWNTAAAAGMKASKLPYSGAYDFAPTRSYWPLNHQVSPAKDALHCIDCHGPNSRLDWKALGYKGDPRKTAKRD